MSSGNVAIYLGFSDLGGFIVESCRQIVDEKVTFGVVSVKYSEGGKVKTQSRKAAEKYFFKCPIKTVSTSTFTLGSIMSIYIHKLLKLPGLDPNLWNLKTLAMSLFILTHFYNKSSLSINNTAHFRHIF